MKLTATFFDPLIRFLISPPYQNFVHRFENLKAVSAHLEKTFILVDQYEKDVMIFNHNAAMLPVFQYENEENHIKESKFIEKISPEYQLLFAHILLIINDYILSHRSSNDNTFYFSFNVPLINQNGEEIMCEFKTFPYLYTDTTPDKNPWVIYYQCDPCKTDNPGRLTRHNLKERSEILYLINLQTDNVLDYLTLKKCDLDIFELACQGFSENEIADILQISIGALKRVKSAIMMHINTQSTAQTITILHKQGLI